MDNTNNTKTPKKTIVEADGQEKAGRGPEARSTPNKPGAETDMIADGEETIFLGLGEDTSTVIGDKGPTDVEEETARMIHRKKRTARRLVQITTDIREVCGRSGNLRRELRNEADKELCEISDKLEKEAEEDDIEEAITLLVWGSRIGQVLLKLEEQRGFSKELVAEMEALREEGMTLIHKYYENEPLNITEEEMRRKRIEWGRAPPRKSTKRQRGSRNTALPDRSIAEETTTESVSQGEDTPPAQRRKTNDEVPTEGTTPIARAQTTRTEAIRRTKAAVRVEAEGSPFEAVVRDLRRRVGTHDLAIRVVRRMRNSKSVIIELTGGEEAAGKLAGRIQEAGYTAVMLAGAKEARVYIPHYDPTVSNDEVYGVVSDALKDKGLAGTIVFTRGNNNGTMAMCLELEEKQAKKLAKIGTLRLGWTETRVRLYEDSRNCYRCGKEGHRAADCRKSKDVSYRCQKPGHIRRDARRGLKLRNSPQKALKTRERGKKTYADGLRQRRERTPRAFESRTRALKLKRFRSRP